MPDHRALRPNTAYHLNQKAPKRLKFRANQPVHALFDFENPSTPIQDTEATHFAKNYFLHND